MTQEEINKIADWMSQTDTFVNMEVQDQLQLASAHMEFMEKIKPLYEKYTMRDGKPIRYIFKG